MKEENIYIAIMGALNKFEGDGGVIASSLNYTENIQLKNNIWEFDKELKHVFNNYSHTGEFIQKISFSKLIDETEYHFLIRAQKQFTKFPEQNRFYDRREYFFYELNSSHDLDVMDFLQSLPPMKQYEENANGKEIFPPVVKHGYSPNIQISNAILRRLMNNDIIKIQVNNHNRQEVEKEILNALSVFSVYYKKYLGFGLNVKDDSFSNNHLHVFSTLDATGIDINELKHDKSSVENENRCIDFLISPRNQYDDTEIKLKYFTTPYIRLYELLGYHRLHYQIDNNIVFGDIENLKKETENYVKEFDRKNNTNKYIQERITSIITFWCKHNILTYSLYKKYKDLCDNQKNPEIDIYIKNIFNREDVSSCSQDQIYEFLLNNLSSLSINRIKECIHQLGPSFLYKKNGLKKLLENNTVREAIIELLEKENIETQLQWKKKYNIIDEKLKKQNSTDSFITFQDTCNAYINGYSEKYKNEVESYVQQSLDLKKAPEFEFYKISLQTAQKYNFKVSLQTHVFGEENILSFYLLFNQFQNNINEVNDILDYLAKKHISIQLNVNEILKFAYSKENREYVQKYIPEFTQQLVKIGKDKKYEAFIAILEYTLKENENLFLQEENELYNTFLEIHDIEEKQCLDIYQLGEYIEKSKIKSKEIFINLIDKIINNMEKKENAKMTNIIAISVRRERKKVILLVVFLAIFFVASTGFGREFFRQKSTITEIQDSLKVSNLTINQLKEEYDNLKQQLQKWENRSKLNPFPNDRLKNDNGEYVIKTDVKDKPIENIVNNIIDSNPNDIRKHYQSQREDYLKYIIELNKDCFINQTDRCECDTLKYIPSYKPD